MTSETFRLIMGIAGVIILASFMPWTAYSFFAYRLTKKKKEYETMLKLLGYTGSKRPAYLPSLENEYQHRDYYLPVAFATVIVTECAVLLIFGTRFFKHSELSFILNGPSLVSIASLKPGVKPEEINSLFGAMIVCFAFIGSYIWAIQYLYRRLATVDLTPSAYYSVGIRIIFSIFVALMIYYLLTNGNISNSTGASTTYDSPTMLALYAFFAGMFPQRAIQYVQDKIHFMKTKNKLKAEPLPLEMIEGIGLFERTRFLEVGIDNAQNLAKSNFVEIIIRTPFNPREIIDWIGQARLYLYFKGDIKYLRNVGVRTIFNLKTLCQDEKNLIAISDLSKEIQLEKLKLVCMEIKDDPDICELQRALSTLVVGKQVQCQY